MFFRKKSKKEPPKRPAPLPSIQPNRICLIGQRPLEWDVGKRPELHPFLPHTLDAAQTNYGQGEGQFRIEDAVWGVYFADGLENGVNLQFEEGTLDIERFVAHIEAIRDAAEKHFGDPFEVRVEGVWAKEMEEP